MSKIMIVDGDVTVQMDLAEYFEESHHHLVGIAETRSEAVSVARKTRPDIILVEIDLPGETNGIDIAESIQTQMDVGIVFMTVCSDFHVVCQAKQVSPLGYVTKPFDARGIGAVIEIALNNQVTNREFRAANQKLERQVVEQKIELASLKDERDNNIMMAKARASVLNGAIFPHLHS